MQHDNFLDYKLFLKLKKKKKDNSKSIALIIGGTGRIGSVFTNQLVYQDHYVISFSRNNENFKRYKSKLPKNKQKFLKWHYLDLSNFDSINNASNFIKSNFSEINFFVNAGSISNRGKNVNYNEKSISNEFYRISGGVIIFLESIIDLMRNNENYSKVINVSSFWGKVAPNFKTYLEMDISPSLLASYGKAGMEHLIKYLAVREAENKILANTLMPGWFPRKGPVERKDYMSNINEKVPLNKIGRLIDLVPAVEFLLNQNNQYFTGQSVIVDGGYTIW